MFNQEDGPAQKAVVKWFNPVKGFGFVAPEDGAGDAFLHVSVLNRAGLQAINDGTEVMVTLAPGAKGRQVEQIIDVLGMAPGGAPASSKSGGGRSSGGFGGGFGGGFNDRDEPPVAPPGAPTFDLSGTVKWFKADKGFGFVAPDDGSKDIFIHKSVLRRANVMILDAGQKVHVTGFEANKGREASTLAVTD